MFERAIDCLLTEPRRLVSLGAALARCGGFLLVAGFAGRVATTAMSAVKGLTGATPPEVSLGDVLPGFLSVWMPESALGFGWALFLLAAGLWVARTGRVYERHLGIRP